MFVKIDVICAFARLVWPLLLEGWSWLFRGCASYRLLLLIAVGASVDPAGVTMIDAVKVYGKTKEQFGWPDEPPEEFPSASVSNICPSNLNQSNGTGDSDSATPTTTSGTVLERYQHWWGLASVFTIFHLLQNLTVS